jgi:hypothetical protein
MKKHLALLALAALPWLALAQSPLDGKWKVDLKSITGADKPTKYAIRDGMYECETCTPAVKVKADGTDQRVEGNPFMDVMTVKVADERTLEVATRKDGKVVSRGKVTISPDGQTMTRDFTYTEPTGLVNKSVMKMTRVGAAPKGTTHGVSGSWKFAATESMTDDTVMFRVANGVVSMNATDGSRYEAKLDGSKAPVKGSTGIDAVSVVMKDKNTLEEMNWRGGTMWLINTMTVSADGRTARVHWENKLNGAKGSYTMTRQ